MGAGHWLNPKTGQYMEVTTHDEWIRNAENASNIGLADDLYRQIMLLPATDNAAVDEIRILAVQGGLIRIRQHKRYTSVQFWVMSDQVDETLQAALRALVELRIHPDERLQIDNLCLGESASVTLRELQSNQAVFQHQ